MYHVLWPKEIWVRDVDLCAISSNMVDEGKGRDTSVPT